MRYVTLGSLSIRPVVVHPARPPNSPDSDESFELHDPSPAISTFSTYMSTFIEFEGIPSLPGAVAGSQGVMMIVIPLTPSGRSPPVKNPVSGISDVERRCAGRRRMGVRCEFGRRYESKSAHHLREDRAVRILLLEVSR